MSKKTTVATNLVGERVRVMGGISEEELPKTLESIKHISNPGPLYKYLGRY